MHDRGTLLAAVSAGHVPIEALATADRDRGLLRAAVSGGHVPREALQTGQ
jgi:hypothetical protein